MTQIADIITHLIFGVFKLVGELLVFLYQLIFPPRTKIYNSKFTPVRKILSKKNKGWLIGADKAISLEKSFEGLILSSQPGAGKTVCFCTGSLVHIAGRCSVVCLDPALQLYNATSGYYTSLGYKIQKINFSDKSGLSSNQWNPFPKVKNEVSAYFTTLFLLSYGGNEKDPFWRLAASSLCSCLGTLLFSFDRKYQTMANLLYLLHLMSSAKSVLVSKLMSKYADEDTWLEFTSFLKNSENVKSSILASAKASLDIFNQEGIKRITSEDGIDFTKLRGEKTIIYVQTSAAQLSTYQLLISIFFNELISHLLDNIPDEKELDIFLLLEESGIYKIPILPVLCVVGRKHRISPAIVCQSLSQIYSKYSKEDATTIISSSYTKLFLSNTEIATGKEISEAAGQFSYRDEQGLQKLAPLITADEIKAIPPGSGLLLHGHHKPVILRNLTPYFKNKRLNKLTSLPPVPLTSPNNVTEVPKLPIMQLLNEISNSK